MTLARPGKRLQAFSGLLELDGGCTTLRLSSREGEVSSVAAECGKMATTKTENLAPHSRIFTF